MWSVTFSNFPSKILIHVVCQPVFGTLYGSFDFRGTFLFGLALFEIGSLVCGVSRSSAVFIVGRAVAGLGAAGVISGPLVLIAKILPMSKRPQFSSLVLSMWGFASVAGPLVSKNCQAGRFVLRLIVHTDGWCPVRQSNVEMVLFHQPTSRVSILRTRPLSSFLRD